ncbi:MAG TPA: hypothetical protein DCE42_01770, partial [Myxococcales bacterium]|nr:hypothetical protein [Myxococcales bacterium]
MRDRYKFLVGVMCFGMLLSVSSPTMAQTTAPKRPTSSALAALTGVAGRLDSDRVLGLVRFHHLYELLPLIFGNKDMPNTKDPKELMQLLPMKFRFILQMTGVDFDKGALFAVQTSRFRSAPVPVHMSLWVWMQDPQVLAGLAQMVKKSGRASLVHIPNPKANQDYYLVQANGERNVPLFLLARDRNLLMSTSLGRPQKYARFFETFAPDWLENAHKTFLDALSKHPNAVAKAKDYKDHVKRFGPAQFTLFVRAEKVVKLIRKRLPKKARSLIDNSVSSFLEALGTFDWGLQIAGKRVSMREKLSFVKKGNPFFSLFEPLKKPIDMGNFLPKGTFFFNTTTVRTERLKRFVMKQLKKRMSAKKTHKMLRGYANVRQRILTHFGVDIEHDILGTLTGQVGAMMMLHTMEALPLMSTHKGVGVFFGVRDSAKASALLARVVK